MNKRGRGKKSASWLSQGEPLFVLKKTLMSQEIAKLYSVKIQHTKKKGKKRKKGKKKESCVTKWQCDDNIYNNRREYDDTIIFIGMI